MSRDHTKLRVFRLADGLVLEIYRVSRTFPAEERYELRRQLRRAAVSVSCNLVEGSARRTARECVNFFNIALGSACESRYLLDLTARLYPDEDLDLSIVIRGYADLIKQLERLVQTTLSLADSDRGL